MSFWTDCEAVGSLTHSKIAPPTLGSSIDLPRPWRKCPRRQLGLLDFGSEVSESIDVPHANILLCHLGILALRIVWNITWVIVCYLSFSFMIDCHYLPNSRGQCFQETLAWDYLDCIACIAIETALPSQSGTITYNFTISGFFRCSGLPKSPRSKCSNLLKKQIGNLWCFWLYCKRKVPADNETTCEWNTRINNSDRVVSVNCKDHEAHKDGLHHCTVWKCNEYVKMYQCVGIFRFFSPCQRVLPRRWYVGAWDRLWERHRHWFWSSTSEVQKSSKINMQKLSIMSNKNNEIINNNNAHVSGGIFAQHLFLSDWNYEITKSDHLHATTEKCLKSQWNDRISVCSNTFRATEPTPHLPPAPRMREPTNVRIYEIQSI